MARGARIGSVITGTVRTADLLRAFSDELRRTDAKGLYGKLADEACAVEPDSDDAQEVLGELETTLGEFAPPYCYFGAHRGDGADFGYWPDWDAIDADRRDGTLPSGSDMPDRPTANGYYLHISDHGNAELYEWDGRQWRSVWGVV